MDKGFTLTSYNGSKLSIIKCAIKEKDTADYIRETEWAYEE